MGRRQVQVFRTVRRETNDKTRIAALALMIFHMLSGMPQIELSGKNNGGVLFLFEKSNEKVHLDYSAGAIVNIEQSGYVSANIKIYAGASVENVVVKPMLECGTSSTAYTKHVSDLSGVSLKKFGKNLLPYPYNQSTKTLAGVTWTVADDGKISASGTATGYTDILLYSGAPIVKSGNLTFGWIGSCSNISVEINFFDSENALLGKKTAVLTSSVKSVSFNMDEYLNCARMLLTIKRSENGTVSAIGYPQLEAGTKNTAYEAYKTPETYTVDADGTVQNLSAYEDVTTLATDNEGTVLKTKYSRDLNAAFTEIQNAIIALGGSF